MSRRFDFSCVCPSVLCVEWLHCTVLVLVTVMSSVCLMGSMSGNIWELNNTMWWRRKGLAYQIPFQWANQKDPLEEVCQFWDVKDLKAWHCWLEGSSCFCSVEGKEGGIKLNNWVRQSNLGWKWERVSRLMETLRISWGAERSQRKPVKLQWFLSLGEHLCVCLTACRGYIQKSVMLFRGNQL